MTIKKTTTSEIRKTLRYVIIRTLNAGVFAGYLVSREKDEVVLKDARRLWFWSGANSLSQLAMEGVRYPDKCRFPCEVSYIELLGVIEVIATTKQAQESIKGVTVWTA